jgi:hypothetical protein
MTRLDDELINKCSRAAAGKHRCGNGLCGSTNREEKAFLTRLVDEGPIPAIHGVLRWRLTTRGAQLGSPFPRGAVKHGRAAGAVIQHSLPAPTATKFRP